LIVAALYGAGAGALADAALKRLGEVAPEAAQALRQDLKAAASGAQRGDTPKRPPSRATTCSHKPSAKTARPRPGKKKQTFDKTSGSGGG
jgi:hypothetical protein